MAKRSRACPHIKAGLSLNDLLIAYKHKCAQSRDISAFICLKCGHKACKSLLSEHVKLRHAHQIAVDAKTMEVWCFKCSKVPDNTDELTQFILQLQSLPYFRKSFKQVTVTQSTSSAKKPTISQPMKVKAQSRKSTKVAEQRTGLFTGVPSFNPCDPMQKSPSGHGVAVGHDRFKLNPPRRLINRKSSGPMNTYNKQKQTDKVVDKWRVVQGSSFVDHSSSSKPRKLKYDSKFSGTVNPITHSNYEAESNRSGSPHPSSKHINVSSRNAPRDLKRQCYEDKTTSKSTISNDGKGIPRRDITTQHSNGCDKKPVVASQPTDPNERHNQGRLLPPTKVCGPAFPTPPYGNVLPEYQPIVGLPNVGNTCFFNSALQIIYQSRYLRHYIATAFSHSYHVELQGPEGLSEYKITTPPGRLTLALFEFLDETKGHVQFKNPQCLLNTLAIWYKRFRGSNQQDSHELFRCLLDGLRTEEIKRHQEGIYPALSGESQSVRAMYEKLVRKSKTFVDKAFGGSLSSTIICRDCLTPIQLTEPFLDLSLSISGLKHKLRSRKSEVEDPYRIQNFLLERNLHYQLKAFEKSNNTFTLEACLRSYTTLEVLDDRNKFICNTCTNSQVNNQVGNALKATSKSSLDGLALCPVSKLLLLHELPKILVLHLKRFKLGATVSKDNRYIEFPFELDVAPYCTNHCKKYLDGDKIMYSLYGVVVHHGTLHGGHYTAYVKAKSTRDVTTTRWYYTSDSHVRPASEEEIKHSNAYMLFYDAADSLTRVH